MADSRLYEALIDHQQTSADAEIASKSESFVLPDPGIQCRKSSSSHYSASNY